MLGMDLGSKVLAEARRRPLVFCVWNLWDERPNGCGHWKRMRGVLKRPGTKLDLHNTWLDLAGVCNVNGNPESEIRPMTGERPSP
jgi:hypothetical protein